MTLLAAQRLAGKRALVTGAAGGQGRAVAERFAREGADVALTDLDAEALPALARDLDALGARVVTHAADVTDEAEVRAVVERAAADLGGIDVLYNNAAIRLQGRDGTVEVVERDAWDLTLAVNVTGTFLFCKHAIPHLLRSEAGVVLTVASTAGLGGDVEAHAYGTSKGALLALTRSIAQRYGADGLRAVAICPGLVDTPMLDAALQDEALTRELIAATALGRIARPGEIAAVAAFLASDDASFITSTVIEVHGGLVK